MTLRRFTVEEYHRLIEVGILTEADKVELLEGWIVHKYRQTPHAAVVSQLTAGALRAILPTSWQVRSRSAVTLSDSEPEPELAVVVDVSPLHYDDHFPGPTEIRILIEVADASLESDRKDKGRIYARAGVAVYWIVNLTHPQVEVYTDPDPAASPPAYRQRQDYPVGTSVPVVLRGQQVGQVAVQDLFP